MRKEGRSRRLIEGDTRKRKGEQIIEMKRKRVERKGRCEIEMEGEEVEDSWEGKAGKRKREWRREIEKEGE